LNAIKNLYGDAVNINANTAPVNYTPAGSSVKDNFDAIDVALARNFPVVSDTSTSKMLTLSDRNTIQTLDNASPITVTIPLDSTVPFPAGGATVINFTQINTGQITFVKEDPSINIISYLDKVTTAGKGAECQFTKLDTNVWQLSGTLI